MIKKIFGLGENEELKEKLNEKKQKISELKNKLEEKNKELKKQEKRAKKAITEKQDTDKELKEAKHKIKSLEDRIKNLEEKKEDRSNLRKVEFIKRKDTLSLIKELKTFKSEKKSLITNYIENPQKAGDKKIINILNRIDSQTGYIHLQDGFKIINCVLVPPIPLKSEFFRKKRFKLEKLLEALNSDTKIGFISAHVGKTAIGLLSGTEILNFNTIKTEIKGKHSKGGFSQGRFERRRKEQIKKHVKKLAEMFKDYIEKSDYIVLNGNRRIITELKNLLPTDRPLIERSLNIGEIETEDKQKYVEKIWGSRLYIL